MRWNQVLRVSRKLKFWKLRKPLKRKEKDWIYKKRSRGIENESVSKKKWLQKRWLKLLIKRSINELKRQNFYEKWCRKLWRTNRKFETWILTEVINYFLELSSETLSSILRSKTSLSTILETLMNTWKTK